MSHDYKGIWGYACEKYSYCFVWVDWKIHFLAFITRNVWGYNLFRYPVKQCNFHPFLQQHHIKVDILSGATSKLDSNGTRLPLLSTDLTESTQQSSRDKIMMRNGLIQALIINTQRQLQLPWQKLSNGHWSSQLKFSDSADSICHTLTCTSRQFLIKRQIKIISLTR